MSPIPATIHAMVLGLGYLAWGTWSGVLGLGTWSKVFGLEYLVWGTWPGVLGLRYLARVLGLGCLAWGPWPWVLYLKIRSKPVRGSSDGIRKMKEISKTARAVCEFRCFCAQASSAFSEM